MRKFLGRISPDLWGLIGAIVFSITIAVVAWQHSQKAEAQPLMQVEQPLTPGNSFLECQKNVTTITYGRVGLEVQRVNRVFVNPECGQMPYGRGSL